MKNKFIIATLFSVFLLVSPNVKAAKFTDNQIVDSNKTWTIKFTSDVGFDDSTKQGITVTDSKGNIVPVVLQLGQDNKTVIVIAPEGGYKSEENYTLNIGGQLHSNKGKALKNEYKLHFNIKNDINSNNSIIIFKDKNLEKAVRDKIDKPTGDILKSDVEKVTELDVTKCDIENISGLEYLTNIEKLNLTNNKISDISSLKSLNNLKELTLRNDNIDKLDALSNLSKLEKLDIGNYRHGVLFWNTYSDISPIKNLKNLKELNLSYTSVNNIDVLKNLTELNVLILRNFNEMWDLKSLENLTNLTYLDLGYTNVVNIDTLRNLNKLTYLNLSNVNEVHKNQRISDITIFKNMTNLVELYLNNANISDDDKQSLKSSLPKCNIAF